MSELICRTNSPSHWEHGEKRVNIFHFAPSCMGTTGLPGGRAAVCRPCRQRQVAWYGATTITMVQQDVYLLFTYGGSGRRDKLLQRISWSSRQQETWWRTAPIPACQPLLPIAGTLSYLLIFFKKNWPS